jgi:hypothetical protein
MEQVEQLQSEVAQLKASATNSGALGKVEAKVAALEAQNSCLRAERTTSGVCVVTSGNGSLTDPIRVKGGRGILDVGVVEEA